MFPDKNEIKLVNGILEMQVIKVKFLQSDLNFTPCCRKFPSHDKGQLYSVRKPDSAQGTPTTGRKLLPEIPTRKFSIFSIYDSVRDTSALNITNKTDLSDYYRLFTPKHIVVYISF